MDNKEGKVTASVEELAHYNMLLTEAIYELLADKGNYLEGRGCGTTQGGDDCKFSPGSTFYFDASGA